MAVAADRAPVTRRTRKERADSGVRCHARARGARSKGRTPLAVTSATVVSGLNTLSSLEAGAGERGGRLGALRSYGQLGRGLGPVLFTSVYWWAGREVAYNLGAAGIAAVSLLVFAGLRAPPGSLKQKGAAAKTSAEKKDL